MRVMAARRTTADRVQALIIEGNGENGVPRMETTAEKMGKLVDDAVMGKTDLSPMPADAVHTLSARGGDAPVDMLSERAHAEDALSDVTS